MNAGTRKMAGGMLAAAIACCAALGAPVAWADDAQPAVLQAAPQRNVATALGQGDATPGALAIATAFAGIDLADGVYTVPVSLTQLKNVDEGTMPGVFLAATARVYVIDAKPWIEASLQPANIMGAEYHADSISFYANESFSLQGTALNLASDPAKMQGQQTLSYSSDSQDRFNHFAATVLSPLAGQALTNGGYVAVRMTSSQMTSDLTLKIEWDKIEVESAGTPQLPAPQPADLDSLEAAVDAAGKCQEGDGPAEQFQLLEAEAQKARELLGEAPAQPRVDAAAKDLNGLVHAYLTHDLKAKLAEAGELQRGKYTAATWAALSRQKTAAQAVVDNAFATRVEARLALEGLSDAMGALEEGSVDKTALDALAKEAEQVEQGLATDAHYKLLQDALETAQDVLGNDEALPDQANDAQKKLTDQLNAFAQNALGDTLAAAQDIQRGNKSEAAFSDLADSIDLAQKVSSRKTATRADRNAATAKLAAAMADFQASPDQVGFSLANLQPNQVFEAKVAWLKAVGDGKSMMSQYMKDRVTVRLQKNGAYVVRFGTASAQADSMIAWFKDPAGRAASVISQAGASPKVYAFAIDDPGVDQLIAVKVTAMGDAAQEVIMRIDLSDAKVVASAIEDGFGDSGTQTSIVQKPEKPVPAPVVAAKTAKGKSYAAGKGASKATYLVTKVATQKTAGAATYVKPASSKLKAATIPDTVQINGQTYQVNAFKAGAFKGCKKLTKVTVGKNVAKLPAKAFAGAPKLKTLVVKSPKLSTKKAVKNCLKSSKVKAVKVSISKKAGKAKVVKAFKSAAGKKVSVK